MAFNPVWETTHKNLLWGSYPSEDLVRWTFKTFGRDYETHKDKLVLDLGCGQGNNSWFLAREGFRVIGIDGSESACLKAQTRMQDEACDNRVTVCCGEFHNLGDSWTGKFDAVIDVVSSCHNTIHSLPDIYREVHRVLVPGGRFFMMCPTDQSSQEPFKGHGAISFITKLDLRLLLQEWFDIVELTKSSYQPDAAHRVEHWVVSAKKR